jgi:putative lipoprotein
MQQTDRSLPWLPVAVVLGVVALASGCQRSEAPAPTPAAEATAPPAAAAPAAPAAADDEAPPEGVLLAYVWTCEDGQTLSARNLWRENALAMDFHEGTQRLDQTVAASGVRYANADESTVFWTKGGSATLERKSAATVQCSERRADSLWADARARGVVYRALGNEPGWTLETGPAGRVVFVTNWGQDRHVFEGATESAAPGGTMFRGTHGTDSIKVTITAERCEDDGDVEFDHTAVVEFSGRTLRGCGRRLN